MEYSYEHNITSKALKYSDGDYVVVCTARGQVSFGIVSGVGGFLTVGGHPVGMANVYALTIEGMLEVRQIQRSLDIIPDNGDFVATIHPYCNEYYLLTGEIYLGDNPSISSMSVELEYLVIVVVYKNVETTIIDDRPRPRRKSLY